MLPFNDIPAEVPADLYRSFLVTYGLSALGRVAVECYKQIAILGSAWYDVPTAAFTVLEHGFIHHALLSFAAAEGLNMVLGALYKNRVRAEARAENNREWVEWLRRKAEAEAKGEPFNDPSPAERSAEAK
ncbi:MAG: hypothetical protein OXL37_12620 [Chloroflexota bacterium]|nr:hypothetical protein [Chloroflexota bacterium]MDE2959339.1 hypothetical protein [Chloroflexota bacterium]